MTKMIFTLAVLLISPRLIAATTEKKTEKKTETISEAIFRDGSKLHTFTLLKTNEEKPTFSLGFQKNREARQLKDISQDQADFIRNESTRIIWTANYSKPSQGRPCRRYASVTSGGESSDVCLENKKATGMTQSLLVTLGSFFQSPL